MTNNKGRCPYYNEDCPKCCKAEKQGEGEWEKDFDAKEWNHWHSKSSSFERLPDSTKEEIKKYIRSLLSNTERRVREETLKEARAYFYGCEEIFWNMWEEYIKRFTNQ
jgi:hypothetical protein